MLGTPPVFGQDFPVKPIRILASGVGGNGDFMARLVAQETTPAFGQPVIVDNRSVVLSVELASKAPPDGYTLLVAGSSFMLGPLLVKKPTYDPVRDFSPVSLVCSSPAILVVHSSVPARSVRELIALAKARPGTLNYSTGATGGPHHLAGELFKSMARIDIVRIPYKGGNAALNDVLGGQVEMTFAVAATVAPHIRSNRIRMLAVTSAQPSALAPGVPTIAASGLPGYESVQLLGLFVPAKTPVPVVDRLNREIVRAVTRSEVKKKFLDSGVEVIGSTPGELAAAMQSEIRRMGKVIKTAGIQDE
jgi:tripartite-type tricarboxylate transporter receptor subunit TctC